MARSKINSNSVDNSISKKVVSNSEPTSASAGDQWWDDDDAALKLYDGTTWKVIKSMFAAQGGTYSEINGYGIHKFTSSGTFQVTRGTSEVEYIVVAGGGAGGGTNAGGGGGGAGGYRSSVIGETSGQNSSPEGVKILGPGLYTVVIGAGGNNADGGNSSFDRDWETDDL